MADETPVNSVTETAEAVAVTPKAEKPKPRARKKPAPAKVKEAATPAVEAVSKPKRYSAADRSKILTSIANSLDGGKATLKTALKAAGISEQTYYNWKNGADKKASTSAPTQGDDLAGLLELEAENKRLRKELAGKLRAENAELRRRLGLA